MSKVRIELVGIDYKGQPADPGVGIATVRFKISGGPNGEIDLALKQEVRRDLHVAVEAARRTLQQFADELVQATREEPFFPTK